MTTNHPLLNMMELFVHHYNEGSAISRAADAKGLGLDPYHYAHPYPGSTNNIIYMGGPQKDVAAATAEKPADAAPADAASAETPPVETPAPANGKRRPWWMNLLPYLLAGGLGAGTVAGIGALNRPATPAAIEYEVYERVDDQPWSKSTLTVEQLLGGKPPPAKDK